MRKSLKISPSLGFKVLASLKRLASGVLTHPVTIGQMIDAHTPKRKKDKPKSIHLMGTDRPEATMIYAGFFIEILNANPGNPIKITLVSPDPANQQLAHDCSPKVAWKSRHNVIS